MKPGSQRHLYDLPAMSAAHPPTRPEPRHPLWPEEEDAAMGSVSLLSKLANPKFPQKAISRATRRRTRLSPRRLPRKCLVAALPLWKRRPGQRCCFGLAPGLRPKTGARSFFKALSAVEGHFTHNSKANCLLDYLLAQVGRTVCGIGSTPKF